MKVFAEPEMIIFETAFEVIAADDDTEHISQEIEFG